MGMLRVTQGIMTNRALNDLNSQTRRLLKLQEQLSTGLRVNAPSDDPLSARRAVNVRTLIGKNEQYLTNISSITPQLRESSTALQTGVNILHRVQELTLEGANGTNSTTQLTMIAQEINQLLESMVVEGNHQTNGRYIFGGTCTLNPPYQATRNAQGQITAVAYAGNTEKSEVAIADGITVSVNVPGQDAFSDAQDVFQMLIDIRDNMLAGDQGSLQNQRLAELTTTRNQLLNAMASVGAIENRLERVSADMEDYNQQLVQVRSDNIDADYAETVVNLNAQSNAFQAALNATARVIRPSLLDYLG